MDLLYIDLGIAILEFMKKSSFHAHDVHAKHLDVEATLHNIRRFPLESVALKGI